MFLSVRAAVVLSVFGLAVDSFNGVVAGPLVRSSGMARVLTSCTQNNLAALTFVRIFILELGLSTNPFRLNRMMDRLIMQGRL